VDASVAVGRVGGVKQFLDFCFEGFAALLAGAGCSVGPFVEAGFRYAEPGEHVCECGSVHLCVVVCVLGGDEPVFLGYRCSLAKYAAAFFRKASSISMSRLRRRSSCSSARSDSSNGA